MELDEETIAAFLAELARRGCPLWERRMHQVRLVELARWIREYQGCGVRGQDAQEAFLWWGQCLWCPDWPVMHQRAVTIETFGRWLLEGRVVAVPESPAGYEQSPGDL